MWPDPRSVYSWRTRKRTASCTTPLSYGQIQECISFTQLSLEAYEATKDEQLLRDAYEGCVKWDRWLTANRMTLGTGLIELFCEFDTGHDNSRRLAGLPKGCVDRYGKKRKFLSILISNLFQEHLLDQDMADSIYERHMKNPREFWTPYPFPSMTISDPASVQDLEGNSWGFYSQGLTALRTLRWLDYYGKSEDLEYLMRRWVSAMVLSEDLQFAQELHPVTGKLSKSSPWYSSSMLFFISSVRRLGLLEENL